MDSTPYSRLLPQSEKFTESPRILPESRIPATRQSIDRVAHRTLLRGGKKLRRSLEVLFQSGLPQTRERESLATYRLVLFPHRQTRTSLAVLRKNLIERTLGSRLHECRTCGVGPQTHTPSAGIIQAKHFSRQQRHTIVRQ